MRWLSPSDIEESLTGVRNGDNESIVGLRTRLGPAASAAEGIDAYLVTTGLTGGALRRARQALGAEVEADADLPTFDSPLPTERTEVVRRLGLGRYEKVALTFDEPFWRKAGWSHPVLFPSETAEPALWVFELDAFSGVPILVGHVFHSATGHLADGASAAARWVTDMITETLGSPCPVSLAIIVTDWSGDPNAAGAIPVCLHPPMPTSTCSVHRWPAACSSRASRRRAGDSATPTVP